MKIISIFFLFSFSFLFSKPLEIEINAESAILINADNNKVLFSKNPHQKMYPASITKVFVIYYVLEKYSQNLNKFFVASEKALEVVAPEKKINSNFSLSPYILETDGSHFDVKAGEKLTLQDYLYGMMLPSGNDASNVVAESLGGSIENFILELNAFLRNLGFVDTFFCNPHGLHMPEHVSTAYEISQIGFLAVKNPKFLEIFSTKYYLRPKTNKQPKKEIITFNQLLKPGKNYYRHAVGAKTGYHAKARYNMLSFASKNNRNLIAVILSCKSDDKKYEDTKKLFETAFAEKKIEKKAIDKETIFQARVQGAKRIIKAQLKNDLLVEYYPSEEGFLKAQIFWDSIKLPIKKGQKVAFVEIKDKDQIVGRANIYAKEKVKRTFFAVLKDLFK